LYSTCESGAGVWRKECGSGRGVMVFGDKEIILAGFGMVAFHLDVLTIWVGQNMEKEVFPEFGLPMTGN
jgi:hypothetical protein